MIYLDYSATTPVNKEVLDSFCISNIEFLGNANSLHKLGTKANMLVDSATKQIANILGVKETEIIYTSGSTEANNLAIKGVCLQYQNRGKHIITTDFEHSSVIEPIHYLEKLGYTVSIVNTTKDGIIDINHLESLITDETILVSINAVNSEVGLLQPVDEIGLMLKKYPRLFYHVDITQMLGKVPVNLTNIDLASASSHKIYGLKGIGCLIKKEHVLLNVQINGGKSTTEYRSGTPAHPLIASFAKSIRLITEQLDNNYEYVLKLNKYLINKLNAIDKVHVNSNEYCIPYIVNISIKGIKSETLMRALEEKDIYVSTKTACSSNDDISEAIYALTKDKELAKSSIRISLSHLTTYEEIDTFIVELKTCLDKLFMN